MSFSGNALIVARRAFGFIAERTLLSPNKMDWE
jgi:hypothetical protein